MKTCSSIISEYSIKEQIDSGVMGGVRVENERTINNTVISSLTQPVSRNGKHTVKQLVR